MSGQNCGLGWLGLEEDSETESAPWLHVAAGERFLGRVLSSEPFWYLGHWSRALREMANCSGPGCAFCVSGLNNQKRFCFDILLESGKRVYLELSRSGASQVAEVVATGSDLRGSGLMVRRPLGGANQPMLIQAAPVVLAADALPAAVDFSEILSSQWERQRRRLHSMQGSLPLAASTLKANSSSSDLEALRKRIAQRRQMSPRDSVARR